MLKIIYGNTIRGNNMRISLVRINLITYIDSFLSTVYLISNMIFR